MARPDPRSDEARFLAQLTPAGWAYYCSGGAYELAPHVKLKQRTIMDAIAETRRVLLEEPPRHGKTEYLRYLVGWYFGRWPDRNVIYAGHSKSLADRFGGLVRRDLDAHGGDVFGVSVSTDTRAKSDFSITQGGGEFFGVGVGGAPHGRGAHLLITDDLVPNAEAASSPVQMAAIEDFLRNDLMSRRMNPFVHVGIQTRWAVMDPHGILNQHWPGKYTTVRLPALAEDDDPLGRPVGAALWPSRFSVEELHEQRDGMHPFRWSAIYQQRPTPEKGGIWQRKWWADTWYALEDRHVYLCNDKYALDSLLRFTVVDLAFTEKKGADYTVIGTFGLTSDKPRRLVLLDMHRERMEYPKLWQRIREQMARWDSGVVYVEEEGQQSMVLQDGRAQGFPVKSVSRRLDADLRISGDKVNVAHEATPLAQQGRMWVPQQADWLANWEGELLTFPNSAHKDMADVTAWACLLAMKMPVGNWWDGYGGQSATISHENGPDAGFSPEDDEDEPTHPLDGMGPRGRWH